MSSGTVNVRTVIHARRRELGGVGVRRVLPARERRMVGPFIFLDHLGPTTLPPGQGIDVPPHPHIHLATVTYLFEGSLLHCDSLGFTQEIRPGEINWMHAGTGIAHSERTSPEARRRNESIHALQLWVALPISEEETPPSFVHYPASALPAWSDADSSGRVLVGEFRGLGSPVATASPTLYLDVTLPPGGSIAMPPARELCMYVVSGAAKVGDASANESELVVFGPRGEPGLVATGTEGARVVFLGGEPVDGERHIWWNFVSSSTERIERARADWELGRFDPVPGDDERMEAPRR
jgi:redox-sensitive bicupin YhaK (pirin superfamily)